MIKDNRTSFSKTSYSNIKKNKLIEEFTKSLYYGDIEDAIKYTGEMIASFYIKELWDTYILFYCKYVNIYNIKFPIFLYKQYTVFREIANSHDNYQIRNNMNIRNIFFYISIITCGLTKNNTIELKKIKIELSIDNLQKYLCADSQSYITKYLKKNVPKDYFISLNEFTYHLKVTNKLEYIYYWINWIIVYDSLQYKNKNILECEDRDIYMKSPGSSNIIWVLWDIILDNCENNDVIKLSINALFDLFTIRYVRANNKKKKILIYLACLFIINKHMDLNVKLKCNMSNAKIMEKNNDTFRELKKKQIINKNIDEDKESIYDIEFII